MPTALVAAVLLSVTTSAAPTLPSVLYVQYTHDDASSSRRHVGGIKIQCVQSGTAADCHFSEVLMIANRASETCTLESHAWRATLAETKAGWKGSSRTAGRCAAGMEHMLDVNEARQRWTYTAMFAVGNADEDCDVYNRPTIRATSFPSPFTMTPVKVDCASVIALAP